MTNLRTFLRTNHSFPRLTKPASILIALLLALGVIAIYVVSATANAPAAAEVRIQTWVNTLKQPQLTVERQDAQQQLELAGEAAVDPLISALHSNDATLRTNASDMLGYIASPRSTVALRDALRNDSIPAVRRNAAFALGEIKDPTTVNDLRQASVLDRNQLVRATANDSLIRIRSQFAKNAGENEMYLGAFSIAPQQTNLVYLTARRDLRVSNDGGKTFQSMPGVLPGQVTTLAVSPRDANVLYAGIPAQGLYKSTDGGKTWIALDTDPALSATARPTITAITIDPTDPNHIFVARGISLGGLQYDFYPLGIVSSSDGGNTWSKVSGSPTTDPVTSLLVSGNKLYAVVRNTVNQITLAD